MIKITDIKEVDGLTLYKFNKVLWVKMTLCKENKFLMLWKQHGEYFEIHFLGDNFELSIGDELEIVSQPPIDVVPNKYINSISELILFFGSNIQKFEIDIRNQTCYFDCSDDEWNNLFKTAEEVNISIPPIEYSHFYSKKYVRLVRKSKVL